MAPGPVVVMVREMQARIRNFYKEKMRGHFQKSYNAILISLYISGGKGA